MSNTFPTRPIVATSSPWVPGRIVIVATLACAPVAHAGPVQWSSDSGGNDHFYEIVPGEVLWTEALDLASAMTFSIEGTTFQGHLATITSAAENAFIYSLIQATPDLPTTWLCGSDAGQEGSFTWRDGLEAGDVFFYTNWTSGQPDNGNVHSAQNYVAMIGQDGSFGFQGGEWDDARLDPQDSILEFRPLAYVVEYSQAKRPSIPGLFNTGVDDAGTVLPPGSAELHFAMEGPSSPAVVIPPFTTWILPPSGSAYVGPANGNYHGPDGDYVYSLTIDLTGVDPDAIRISGQWTSDNNAFIVLNGCETEFNNLGVGYPFVELFTFNLATGFVPGVNVIEFHVNNAPHVPPNPTGLLVADLQFDVSCPMDTDGTGGVEIGDFIQLLDSWGPCGVCCNSDVDGDGIVGILDLLQLLANWGPCP